MTIKYTIGIIGWKSSWGNYCFRRLQGKGHTFLLKDKEESEVSIQQIAQEADIIIVAVPLRFMNDTLSSLGPLLQNQLVIEFASRKKASLEILKRTHAEFLLVHPLEAAPKKGVLLRGVDLVVWLERVGVFSPWVTSFLSSTQAVRLTGIDPLVHDHVMISNQNAVYLANLFVACTTQMLGADPQQLVTMQTKLGKKNFASMARMLLNSEAAIYGDLLRNGDDAAELRTIFRTAADRVYSVIGNDEKLSVMLHESRKYFGDELLLKMVKDEYT
jgi:prephenate dehydrogenase